MLIGILVDSLLKTSRTFIHLLYEADNVSLKYQEQLFAASVEKAKEFSHHQ
jgi:hypothetical protein